MYSNPPAAVETFSTSIYVSPFHQLIKQSWSREPTWLIGLCACELGASVFLLIRLDVRFQVYSS